MFRRPRLRTLEHSRRNQADNYADLEKYTTGKERYLVDGVDKTDELIGRIRRSIARTDEHIKELESDA